MSEPETKHPAKPPSFGAEETWVLGPGAPDALPCLVWAMAALLHESAASMCLMQASGSHSHALSHSHARI
jgi:hypothetical protein